MGFRAYDVHGDTVNLAVTTASQALAVNTAPVGNRSVRIANIGTQTVFLKFGASGVTTTAGAGFPMLGNSVETFLIRADQTHVAAIAGATGNTIYVTLGEGA